MPFTALAWLTNQTAWRAFFYTNVRPILIDNSRSHQLNTTPTPSKTSKPTRITSQSVTDSNIQTVLIRDTFAQSFSSSSICPLNPHYHPSSLPMYHLCLSLLSPWYPQSWAQRGIGCSWGIYTLHWVRRRAPMLVLEPMALIMGRRGRLCWWVFCGVGNFGDRRRRD